MKNIKSKFSIATLAFLMLFSVSCKKGYFTDIDTNLDNPEKVTPKVLLPSAEASIAYSLGGDGSRFTSIFTQQITGGSRQFYAYNRYIMTEEDFNNFWDNMYAGGMMDLSDIIKQSDAKSGQYTIYGGVARILMAYSLGNMTDMFGDIPYAEAFKGSSNLKPAYESQEQIYIDIQNLLSAAIDSINNDDGNDLDAPGVNDFIFKGNTGNWVKLANGLKARYALHLTKRDPGAAQKALDALSAGALTSNSNDAAFTFGAANANPWYQYINERDDILYDGYLIQSMQNKNDPRYGVYIDTADVYWGTGYLGAYYAADNSPVDFFTYAEQKFIEAEANARLNDLVGAQAALTEAIAANMSKLGVDAADAATYQSSLPAFPGTKDSAIAYIMNEKYYAMYLSPEAWVDYRRTGQPELTPNDGVLSQIPRRFIYPTSERLYNPNGVNQNTNLLNPGLWWDN